MIRLPFQKKKETLKKADTEQKEPKGLKQKKDKNSIASYVLKEPIVSEKGTFLEKDGKFLFKVFTKANKPQIKKAIEGLYKVKVKKINIVKVQGKTRKVRGVEGYRPGYKKAIVTLEGDQKIEITSK